MSDGLAKFLEANMFDGDASGRISMDGRALIQEVCELVAQWFVWAADLDAYMAYYCTGRRPTPLPKLLNAPVRPLEQTDKEKK